MFTTCFHKCINCHEHHTYTMTQCTSHSVWYRYVLINLIMCNWHFRSKYVFLSMHILRGSNLCYIELWSCLIWYILLIISLLCLWLMCVQVYFKPSHRYIARELESSAKTKASTPLYYSSFTVAPHCSLQTWYNLHSFIYDHRGRKYLKGLYFIPSIRFWRFMPKGEKVLAQSKRTAPPP
jgi:hypothetical protein